MGRLLPHGHYVLFPAVLTTMGWLAALFQDNCDYVRLTGSVVADLSTTDNTPWLEVGFSAYREPTFSNGEWQVVYTGNCLEYPDDVIDQDTAWTAAKAFAFIAVVLGGGGTLFLWFSTCCVFGRPTWRFTGYQVLLAAMFQSLSFIWFASSLCQDAGNTCDLFWGSTADIVAACLWTVAALSILCFYPVPKEQEVGDGLFVERGATAAVTTRPSVAMSESSATDTATTDMGDAQTVTTMDDAITVDRMEEDGLGDGNETAATMSSGQDSQQDGSNKDLDEVEIV